MIRFTRFLTTLIALGLCLALSNWTADAGLIGGPVSQHATVPAGESVFYDVQLRVGQTVVTVIGNGRTILNLYVYDTDGHTIVGTGKWDRKVAVVSVYREGYFRIEVRNMAGQEANTFLISVT
jgi:hypothetical protein